MQELVAHRCRQGAKPEGSVQERRATRVGARNENRTTWALQFSGMLHQPYLAGPLWHAHEMVFGFTLAVIVGLLFTAGRNWSNQPTLTGWELAAWRRCGSPDASSC